MKGNNKNKKYNKNYYKYQYNQKKKKKIILDNEEIEQLDNILLQNNEVDVIPQKKICQVIQENGQDYEEMDYEPIKKLVKKNLFKNKLKNLLGKSTLKLGLSFIILLAIVIGTSYSYFTYRKEDTRQADIASGEVYVTLVESVVNKSIKLYPRTVEEARAKTDNYIDFTIKGKNTSEVKDILYQLNINNGEQVQGKVRINPQYLLVDLQEKVGNNYNYIKNAEPLSTFSFKDAVPKNTGNEVTKQYRLRIWVSDAIIISDTETNRTYTQSEFNNLFANFNITINSEDGIDQNGTRKVLAAIEAKEADTNVQCSNITYVEDGITYLSGTNDCVDMNYVWYSGKLWRITVIYPDGSMKLVTEDNITSIFWGSDVEYDGSWVYQWLNEDFYDTLVNPSSIIESNSTWNYSTDGNSTPVRPETIETQKTKTASVGLLNVYEYYNAYRNSSASANYLNIGYYWWLITPYSTSDVCRVDNNGNLGSRSPSSYVYGVRPSINLKSGLEFTGEGTKTSPYKIVGDKEDAVNNTTLLSNRSIGEYVTFDSDLYRIVDTTNGITKLTKVDYLRDNGTVINKNLASTIYFGRSTNTGSDTYWDYYLNNTWYNSISSTYKSMLVDGTYYLGLYRSNTNYKATICKDADLNSVITKTCTKYTSTDTDKTWTGKVGLPRVGEMFSSQLGSGYSTSSDMWTATPQSTSAVRGVSNDGTLYNHSPSSRLHGVRPSITLRSGIKITGGTGYVGGDTNSPFEISE